MLRLWRGAVFTACFALLNGPSFATNPIETAPDFSRNDLAGHLVHLVDYRGKVVLLNFWASWCGPCREEMPGFSQWQHEYGAKGLQVIGVAMDDDAESAQKFLKQYPVSYPIVMGDAKLGESFGGVLGLPTSYLIDVRGRIVARYQGESNLKEMKAQIQALLSHMTH
jgi:cytochrome c biogenesis protein CcmG, thiol:disulfide interchange protein DsbE